MLNKNEASNLRGLLNKLSIDGSGSGTSKSARRKRKKRAQLGMQSTPAAYNASIGSSGGRKRRRRRGGLVPTADGSVAIRRKEIFCEVKTDSNGKFNQTFDFYPDADSLPFLFGLFKMYEKVVFHSVTVTYIPAVGTSTNGLIIFGWDGSGDKVVPGNRAAVAALMPMMDGPVWSSRSIRLTQKQMMSRDAYSVHNFATEGENPGSIKIYTSGDKSTVYGELWVDYHVSFSSPRVAS